MGAAPEPGEINPQTMQPGEVKTVSVAFSEFAFVEGDMGFQEARNIWFPQRLQSPPLLLPVGTYDIRAAIRFRSFPNRPNLPPEIVEAQRALEAGPIPLWSGAEIYSNSARVEVKADATVQNSESIRIAADTAMGLLDFLSVLRQPEFSRLDRFAGLRNDLRVVMETASALRNNDSLVTETTRTQIRAFRDALTQAATRAAEISTRANESQQDRVNARWLASQLQGFAPPILEAAR
jgi:hypothetical protein